MVTIPMMQRYGCLREPFTSPKPPLLLWLHISLTIFKRFLMCLITGWCIVPLSVVRFMKCSKALRCEGDRYADWASETTQKGERERERCSCRNVHLRSRRGWTDDDMRRLATAFHPYLHPPQSNRVPHPSVANAIRRIYLFLWDTPRI